MTAELVMLLSVLMPLASAWLLLQWWRRDLAEDAEDEERAQARRERRLAKLARVSNGRKSR